MEENDSTNNFNSSQNFSETFEELGINQLPLVTKRRKHNLAELQIDEHGKIDVEEDDDDDFSIFETKGRKRKMEGRENPVKTKKAKKNISATKFTCDVCGSNFTRTFNLNRHKKTFHIE